MENKKNVEDIKKVEKGELTNENNKSLRLMNGVIGGTLMDANLNWDNAEINEFLDTPLIEFIDKLITDLEEVVDKKKEEMTMRHMLEFLNETFESMKLDEEDEEEDDEE